VKAIGFAGYSGAGKTTLVERLIPLLKAQGRRVSVVKHAHHRFDIDHPGKDTYRHREAGAFEVVVASDRRLALIREFERPVQLSVHDLIAELDPGVDWVLVEGFRHADLPKIEVWREPAPDAPQRPPHYGDDAQIVAIATDAPGRLPHPTALPVLDINDAGAVVVWLLAQADRFDYKLAHHV
jgi:molybdopterin-guanine dinucleotide biosynthesis protein B